MNILILPDIHGRNFFKKPCENIDEYDKVVFLGDYFDPYEFEHISFRQAIDNFKIILELKKNNMDKVTLLIGNHDCPYLFDDYYKLSSYHCRHSDTYHDEIHKLLNDNIELLQLACVFDDILFTHAGVTDGWLYDVLMYENKDIKVQELCDYLNGLKNTKEGIKQLYYVSGYRGGYNWFGSCIWADVREHSFAPNYESNLKDIKQVFGHTLQAHYSKTYDVLYDNPIEKDNYKMVDTTHAYELNTENFTIKEIN